MGRGEELAYKTKRRVVIGWKAQNNTWSIQVGSGKIVNISKAIFDELFELAEPSP